jgi:hypothetical protein
MMKTGSSLTRDIVGPAGSTSDGAFSCRGCEDELCRGGGGLLLEDCAPAFEEPEVVRRERAMDRTLANLEIWLDGIKKDLA